MRLIKHLYRRAFREPPQYLLTELRECKTILDLGCGRNSPVQGADWAYRVGVDAFKPYLDEAKKNKTHDKLILSDITKVSFESKSFDAVVAFDIIEHLTKDQALGLIKSMENWARKKIIIYTPNGLLHQDEFDKNKYQEHRSGWTAKDMREIGFNVRGMHGFRGLRTEHAGIRFKPTAFWLVVSDLTQKIAYRCPRKAFQLFAVKNID